ncbi:COX15/CtaA family protein [Alicyclobacillus dauci]|uniref:COX15/CtaA family protein n=1 Tax=Alicyclobacillus dauci TaxID=1475485 RepID=A0ABY6Z0Z3_9BACL|nr:COX15/CtaA family protein [Alicyclobacillus dauci]WAH36512.1 COX15/CtaA family protein [Alicyclobacillus dauci]
MPRGRGWGIAAFVLSLLATIQTFIVNSMGFLDAATGSAFGCGHEWLHCNNQIIPSQWGLHTAIEFMHRVGVPILTVLLLATIVLANVRYRKWIEIPIFSAISIFFVILEAFLGAMAVVHDEPPAVIATHFGVSLLAFSSSLLLTIYIWRAERVRRASLESGRLMPLREVNLTRGLRLWAWLAIPYIYIAMYVGAYISSSDAGDSFRGWPIPTESVTAPNDALALDWLHRSLALILVLWMVLLFVKAYRTRGERRDLYTGTVFALVFVVLQAFSGMYLVLTHMSLLAFLIHVSVITGLFGTLCFIAVQTLPPSRRSVREPDAPGRDIRTGSRI